MQIKPTMMGVTVVLGLAMALGGCSSVVGPQGQATLDNAGFMSVYDVYRHCQAATDADLMYADQQKLRTAAKRQESSSLGSFPLPDFLNDMVEKQASRLAVEPGAMAASCALSTGQAALRAERMDLASEMFRSVLERDSQPEYTYYVDQARIGLSQVDRAARFAGFPDRATVAIPISTPVSVPGSRLPVPSIH